MRQGETRQDVTEMETWGDVGERAGRWARQGGMQVTWQEVGETGNVGHGGTHQGPLHPWARQGRTRVRGRALGEARWDTGNVRRGGMQVRGRGTGQGEAGCGQCETQWDVGERVGHWMR